jgi:hypothetical protein
MADSTRTPHSSSPSRSLLAIVASALALTFACGFSAAPARADGDPASDVLATQALFLPQDAGIPVAQQTQLAALLQTAARSGNPVRVALIASPTDLGSITELWRQPANYAQFLGQELSLTYRAMLLVIMPNGFGVFDQDHPLAAERSALARIPVRPPGAGLATTALEAVQQLAVAAGHPLPLPQAQTHGATSSGDVGPWIAFAVGLALIIAAWTASLRVRPPRAGRKDLPAS